MGKENNACYNSLNSLSFLIGRKRAVNFVTSSTCRLNNNHVETLKVTANHVMHYF